MCQSSGTWHSETLRRHLRDVVPPTQIKEWRFREVMSWQRSHSWFVTKPGLLISHEVTVHNKKMPCHSLLSDWCWQLINGIKKMLPFPVVDSWAISAASCLTCLSLEAESEDKRIYTVFSNALKPSLREELQWVLPWTMSQCLLQEWLETQLGAVTLLEVCGLLQWCRGNWQRTAMSCWKCQGHGLAVVVVTAWPMAFEKQQRRCELTLARALPSYAPCLPS